MGKMRVLRPPSLLPLLLLWAAAAEATFRLTNLKCEALDKPFAEFSVCRLTVPSRNKIVMNLHVVLHQVPLSDLILNMALHKKFTGYRPFLYNYTLDFCRLIGNQRRNPFLRTFFDLLTQDSNMNHTCPYDHDIIVRNMHFTDEKFKFLPLPLGEYMFHLKVAAHGDWKVNLRIFFKIF